MAFVSKSFTEVQLRWSVIQKEAYAIFYCCTALDYLLRDRKFVIQTDHRNLIYLRKNTNSMVIRWDIALQELDYTVDFLSGSKNVIADTMSRLCLNLISLPDSATIAALENFKEIAEDKIEPLTQCHNSIIGHGGTDRTLSNLQQLGHNWPYMRQDVKHFILTCPVCQKLNTAKNIVKAHPFTTSSERPMKVLNIDLVGPFQDNEYILVVICTHSRWIELFFCPDATAKSAAHALLENFGRYGTFHELRSDRGPAFVNAIIKKFLRLTGTHHHLTLAYSSEENAIVERANREVNRYLRALVYDTTSTTDLKLKLPFVQRIMNATPNSVTKIKPAQILFGNLIDLDENILTPTPEIPDTLSRTEETDRMLEVQEELISRATKYRKLADSTRLANYDLPDKDFAPNTFVLIQYVTKAPSRLHTPWFGPMKVISNEGSKYLLLDLITKKEKHIHVTRIKEFLFAPSRVDPTDVARRDYLEYFVEAILKHKGDTKVLSSLQFYVKWLKHDSTHNTWEPWKNLRSVEALHIYLRSHNLAHLVPKEFVHPRDP